MSPIPGTLDPNQGDNMKKILKQRLADFKPLNPGMSAEEIQNNINYNFGQMTPAETQEVLNMVADIQGGPPIAFPPDAKIEFIITNVAGSINGFDPKGLSVEQKQAAEALGIDNNPYRSIMKQQTDLEKWEAGEHRSPLPYDPVRPAQEYDPETNQYRYIDPISGEPGEDPNGPQPVDESGDTEDLEAENQDAKNYYQ